MFSKKMVAKASSILVEQLESRWLMSWAGYAKLVGQDKAATDYPSITGKGVTVAVIDTGVDYNLPALGGGFGTNKKVIAGWDFVDNDPFPMDESGHGTSVAGVIAANKYTVNGVTYQGVAPDAKIVALRVGTDDGIPNANIEKALQWVLNNYQKYDISVVNLSLGSGNYTDAQSDNEMSDLFKQLRSDGIFVVAASGNSNDSFSGPISQDGVAYPAADSNVFAVGAVDSSDVIATWVQRSSELDLLAPGVDIVMPKMGGGTVTEDGTSFASPYVAGAAALIKQENPNDKPGDIGSILMSSGASNRDGDSETGNTTGLLFSRLNIDAALGLTLAREGTHDSVDFGKIFDSALDSQGILHVAYYDKASEHLVYLTKNASGTWSDPKVIDSSGDVGGQLSIAVDSDGKVGIAYYDNTNTALKYTMFTGTSWQTTTLDSNKNVGNSPSLGFDADGNAYIAYYRKSGGYLRLATLNRDANVWSWQTVDGGSANVGSDVSLDVGEAALRSNGFTFYDTTIAMAYSDNTNGDLKYARLDIDAASPSWYVAVVDNLNGVNNIDLNLHTGPLQNGLQAQIAYQDTNGADVKYAYRNTDWFTETVAGAGKLGDTVQLSFSSSDNPQITFFNRTKKALYISTRGSGANGKWSAASRIGPSSGPMSVGENERTGETTISYLNRAQTGIDSSELV